MKKRLTALLLLLIFSINTLAFAESTLPIDQKKELIKMLYFSAKSQAKEEIDTADFFATALMKITGEDDAEFEKTLAAVLQSIDEYGDYITKEDDVLFSSDLLGTSGGIGATVTMRNGRFTIETVLSGSPAEKAGLKADYVILKVNDTLLEGMSLNKALTYVRGEVGTEIDLLIEISENETAVYTLTRDKIEIKSVTSTLIGKDKNISYINISNFSQETGNEFSGFIKELNDLKIDKMIIDLRNNGGGDLQGAVEVCDALLKKGDTIVTIEPKDIEDSLSFTASGQEFAGEIVVLVNKYSASASEVLTGALKDNKRATVIGTKTYGKGTVQNVWPLFMFGGKYKFTTAYYNTPSGVCINKIGINPHLTVENKTYNIPEEEMPKITFLRELKQGNTGVDVLEIKKGLGFLGFKVTENETYDYEMTNAVKSFQNAVDIEITGNCDVNTMQNLSYTLSEIKFEDDTQLETALKFFEEGL